MLQCEGPLGTCLVQPAGRGRTLDYRTSPQSVERPSHRTEVEWSPWWLRARRRGSCGLVFVGVPQKVSSSECWWSHCPGCAERHTAPHRGLRWKRMPGACDCDLTHRSGRKDGSRDGTGATVGGDTLSRQPRPSRKPWVTWVAACPSEGQTWLVWTLSLQSWSHAASGQGPVS